AVLYYIARARHVVGRDGKPARHRLQYNEPERIEPAREDEYVGLCVHMPELAVRHGTRELDVGVFGPERSEVWPTAVETLPVSANPRKVFEVLVLADAADLHIRFLAVPLRTAFRIE